MKNSPRYLIVVAILAGFTTIRAQQPIAPTSSPLGYSVVASDANSTVWEQTNYQKDPSGAGIAIPHRYTELSTGLNSQQNGKWQRAREGISVLAPGGQFAAAATNTQHQAWFPLDVSQGIIQLTTPDGLELKSRPVGLFFEDDSNSVWIGLLTNCAGELVGSNQVIYPNAFEGVSASLRYTTTRAGFEQDVVIQSQLPDPAELGLVPSRTRLGVLTAFFDTNEPVVVPGVTDPATGLNDSSLAFGTMKMVRGRAFSTGNDTVRPPIGSSAAPRKNWAAQISQPGSSTSSETPTYKNWFKQNGRSFLMEEVPYARLAAQLSQLPQSTARLNLSETNYVAKSSFVKAIPSRLLSDPVAVQPTKTEIMRISRGDQNWARAVVLDYVAVSGHPGDFTFKGDTTYYVSGQLYLQNVTFEGGTVIKYPNAAYMSTTSLGAWDATAFIDVQTVTCQTSSYRPAIFTASDDDTVGETISGSTGSPLGNYYANPALFMESSSVNLSNLRINYASLAFFVADGYNLTVSDSQVNQGQVMIVDGYNDGYSGGVTMTFNNCLYNGGSYQGGIFAVDYGCNSVANSFQLTNCTVDNVYYLIAGPNLGLDYGYAVNCIFGDGASPAGTWQGSYNGFYSVNGTFGSPYYSLGSSPFSVVGAGNYYLSASTLQALGTTSISPILSDDLKNKTTHPPILYSNVTFPVSTNFAAQATRDNSGSAFDLGYHYDPVDYFVGGVIARSNVTVSSGTVIGWFETGSASYGISLTNGASATFNGTLTSPCVFARYDTVQEGGDGSIWTPKGTLGGVVNGGTYNTNSPANITATFTHFAKLAADPGPFRDGFSGQPILVQAKSSEFYGGAAGSNIVASYTNCLFLRANVGITNASAYPSQYFVNCTFYGGNLGFGHNESASPYWYSYIYNCAFDGTTFDIGDPFGSNTNYANYDYNAFNSGGAQPPTEGSHTKTVSGGFNWQSGRFGNFYLPNNSSLTNAGSVTADQVGLYHFTTQTNQVKETNSIVDIGYHYVALDGSGNPFDTNSNGIPDYIEDANGNGIYDLGDLSDWQSAFNNGVPYAWYAANGLGMQSGTQDPDFDALLNYQEYLYGTDPNISEGFSIWVGTPNNTSIP